MVEKDTQQVKKRKDTKKFTWRIENFLKLSETTVNSDSFLVGGHKWRVLVYPKGNKVDYLSVYLDFVDPKMMPDGWSVPADFSFTLVDQLGGTSSVKKIISTTHSFTAREDDWGFTSFIPIIDLSQKGYIVNDTLIIEAEVTTDASASEAAIDDDAKVIEADQPPKSTKESLSDPLSPELQVDNHVKANGNASSSFSPSTVQSTTRNLILELSNMTCSRRNSSSSDGNSSSDPGHNSGLLQQQMEKLYDLFDRSLESLHQTNSLDEAEDIAHEILLLATDPLQKTALKDLISRLTEFKDTVPSSLSTIETSLAIEATKAEITNDLEQRLAHRKGQLTSLEAEVSRLKGEGSKLDVEIQQLTSRKARILKHMNSTEVELEKANQEASNELDELKKEHQERKEAGEKRMRAMEKLAHANASWKLFKNLGLANFS
ncbi:Ubiquitin C-terminal hydrolase 13 [Linum perenne]